MHQGSIRQRVAAFVTGEYPRVVGAVAVATKDRDRAEDAVQDALIKALTHRGEIVNLPAWVTAVAVNEARTAQRRAGAEGRAVERIGSAMADPPDTAQSAVDTADIGTAVAALPDRQRQIVTLFYLLDVGIGDIAATLSVTTGTVKTQLHRARNTLADALGTEAAR